MKCLSCSAEGSHFPQKICATCRSKGICRADIEVSSHEEGFMGREASKEAGEFVADLRKEKNVSHIHYYFTEALNPQFNKMRVTWKEYALKTSGAVGGKR